MVNGPPPPAHPIIALLVELGLSAPESFVPHHPRVRDRDDIGVLRCTRSGVMVLDRVDHAAAAYQDRDDLSYWGAAERAAALRGLQADDARRARLLTPLLPGRAWLDVGTGLGGVLDLAAPQAAAVGAVEPQAGPRRLLQTLGYPVWADVAEVPAGRFDLATLFHCLEHLTDPLGVLRALRARLAPGATLCVEVPQANDLLLRFFDLAAFKSFTFWSQHLILHTRASLEALLVAAGFQGVVIQGVQRYPLANHLHWLAEGRPGGHTAWPFLRDPALDAAYEAVLARLDMTDTLLATATNPASASPPA